MRWLSLVLMALLVASISACGSDEPLGTEAAIRAYFDAWNERDVDLIMSHVAPDAELEIEPVGVVWSDPGEIRDAFETMFARSEWTVEVSDFEVDGDSATYNFVITYPDGAVAERGRSRAVVEDGLIKREEVVGAYRS